MGFLDAYDTFVNDKCNELTEQNNTAQKLTEALGLSNVVGGVENFISEGVVESLKDSPLRELSEDVLSQAITNNARRLSQNIMNQIPDKLTNTLSDLRSSAFNAVFSTMTFQNDLVLYFAATVARETVEAIKDKRKTLLGLKESIRKLHNALLTLAGGGSFFNEYLDNLRNALLRLEDADNQLALVQSSFFSQTVFPQQNFERAKQFLEEAHQLIVPPVTGEDGEELNQGFLENVFELPSFGRKLSMLMAIPKLTMEMLGSYDLYAAKVIKVNTLLLGFQSTVQNLEKVTGGEFKDLITSHLEDSREYLDTIKRSMAFNLNGDELAVDFPIQEPFGNPVTIRGETTQRTREYRPNPTKTSARAIEWGVKVKSLQVMLETIDAEALQTLSVSNNALDAYNTAIASLGELDDRVTSLAILRATDGREQPGDIESQFITFAFQANQAIFDSSLTEGTPQRFDSSVVLSLGAALNARIQLSIDQDREIEQILLRFIKKTGPLLEGIQALGDSVFNLLDDLGMDRASDSLRRGAFGDFFAMDGRTATYAGAAVTALSSLQALTNTQEQRNCIIESINKIQTEDTSKKLAAQRKVSENYVKQQAQNQEKCTELKRDQAKTEGCASGFDITELRDNPLRSVQGLFRGVFGGDISDSLGGSGLGSFREVIGSKPNLGGVVNLPTTELEGISGVFSNPEFADIAASDAAQAAQNVVGQAENELKGALSNLEDFAPTEGDAFESLKEKANLAKEQGVELPELDEAIATSGIADESLSEADELLKNKEKVKSPFRGLA